MPATSVCTAIEPKCVRTYVWVLQIMMVMMLILDITEQIQKGVAGLPGVAMHDCLLNDLVPDVPSVPDSVPDVPGVPDSVPDVPGVPDSVPDVPGVPDSVPDAPAVPESRPIVGGGAPGVPDSVPDVPARAWRADTYDHVISHFDGHKS